MWHDDSFDAGTENAVRRHLEFHWQSLRRWHCVDELRDECQRAACGTSNAHGWKYVSLDYCWSGFHDVLGWVVLRSQTIAPVVIVVTWQRFDFDYEEKVRKRRAGSVAWDSESWSARSRGVCARDIEGRVGRNIDKEMWTLVDRCIVGTKLEKIRWF